LGREALEDVSRFDRLDLFPHEKHCHLNRSDSGDSHPELADGSEPWVRKLRDARFARIFADR